MFHINIDEMLDIQDIVFEVYIEDKLTNRQQLSAPKDMIVEHFFQTARQIQNDRRPIKIKMIRPTVIWDELDKKERILNNEIELSNSAMVAWKEANKDE